MGGRDPRAAEREEARLVASRLPAELQALRAQVHLTRVRARARVRVRVRVRVSYGTASSCSTILSPGSSVTAATTARHARALVVVRVWVRGLGLG